eukprot:NODE_24_length_36516_cov_0.652470.p5 type:complete len:698 gc:universal NODE_24_length_36516_cov_0.652470:27100-29193(+)
MGFNKFYQFGITFEPNFLDRTNNYDIYEWRQLKQDYINRMNIFQNEINGSTPHPSPSVEVEKSFISNNDSIILPNVVPVPSNQFHSISVQTSFIKSPIKDTDNTIGCAVDSENVSEIDYSLLVYKEAFLKSSKLNDSPDASEIRLFADDESPSPIISPPINVPASSLALPFTSDPQELLKSDSVENENTNPNDKRDISFNEQSPSGPFKSHVLNRIATIVGPSQSTRVPIDQSSNASSLRNAPLDVPFDQSNPTDIMSTSSEISLNDYLSELKQLISYNQDLMNKPLDIIPNHHIPKIVEYSTSELDDSPDTPKRRVRNRYRKPVEKSAGDEQLDEHKILEVATAKSILAAESALNSPIPSPRLNYSSTPRTRSSSRIANRPITPPSAISLKRPSSASRKHKKTKLLDLDEADHQNVDVDEADHQNVHDDAHDVVVAELEPDEISEQQLDNMNEIDRADDNAVDNENGNLLDDLLSKHEAPLDIPDIEEYNEIQQPTPKPRKQAKVPRKRGVKNTKSTPVAQTGAIGLRTRKKNLRKSFIDNEWVDADNISNKQMNVVSKCDDGEYIVIEEIEKTIHGVKRDKHKKSASRKSVDVKSAKKDNKDTAVPFKIANSIVKKPTVKQVKQSTSDVFIDLKEQENYHIGYIGLTKGVELNGKEIGNAVYIVSSGRVTFNRNNEEDCIGQAKDVLIVNKGNNN